MVDRPTDPIELPEYHPWRSAIIFMAAFILSAAASLSYVYTRPAEYRATSRLQILPARSVAEADHIRPPILRDRDGSILTEVQVLTSRPLLQEAVIRLNRAGTIPDLGQDPVRAVQHLLQARTVERTQVVELLAEGPQQIFLERLVDTVAQAYRDRTAGLYKEQNSREYRAVKDEVENLHLQAVAARAKLDTFREANGIASDDGEKVVIADLRNLSLAYAASAETFTEAQAHLQTLKKMLNGGRAAEGVENDPAVATLEQRAAALREQLADLQRRFTPEYLALDPETKSLPGRVAALDRQIAAKRAAEEAAPILAAEQELQSSEMQIDRLRRDWAARQKKAEEFAARLAEYKVMQDDLGEMEQIERLTFDRLTNLQASQNNQAPRVEILQPAMSSAVPVRPDYPRNAWIAIVASVGFGVFAAGLAGFLAGPPAVAFCDESIHMQCWDATRALTFDPVGPQRLASDPGLIRLLPPPDPHPSI